MFEISIVLKPHSESLINLSSWLKQFFIILKEIYRNIKIIIIEMIEPYSSEIIAIM